MPVIAKLVVVALVERSTGKVDVAVVVAVKYEPTTWPRTESGAYGEVVPIPMYPADVILILSVRAPSELAPLVEKARSPIEF